MIKAELTAAEKYELQRSEHLEKLVQAARRKVTGSIARHRKLIRNLNADLEKHGDPDVWKKYGDLLLANAKTAVRSGDIFRVIDYFDDATPELEIIGEANRPVSEIAEGYFRRYAKSRNGQAVIAERIAATEAKIVADTQLLTQIEIWARTDDEASLTRILEPARKPTEVKRKKKKEIEFNGARRFVSSDGFEILVGKKAVDNDFLTFRVAKSLDTWMHAADYPGSHVIIRNPNRKEVPRVTLHEAARLAAFYSGARNLGKAAVNYTQKKFVNKPKRSTPGLVSLLSFRTLFVETTIPPAIDNR
jgi:predicted ribosome quality control (RQC) complex YloA/Tae2 family protein